MATINDLYIDDNGFIACKENQTSKEWDSLLTELFKDWQNLKASNDNMDVTILNYQLDTLPTLNREIEQLKAELKTAKCEGFEERFFKAIDQEKVNSCKPKEIGGIRTGDYRIGLEKAKDLFENCK